jgi:Tol biopolymer transport system component
MRPRAWVVPLAVVGTVVTTAATSSESDSQALVYTAGRGQALELRAISPGGTGARTMANLGDELIDDVTLSPDGQAAALLDDAGLSIIDLRDGTKRIVAPDAISAGYTWAPDSRRIAYRSKGPNPQIYVVRVDGSHRSRLTHTRPPKRTWSTYIGLEWAPDGKRIAFMKWQAYDSHHPPVGGRIGLVTISGKQTLLTRVRPFVPASLAWSPNSKALAAGGVSDAGVMIVPVGRGKPQYLRATTCCVGVDPSWSPDGKRLAFLSGDTSLSDAGGVIELASNRVTVFHQFAPAYDPVWARDSRHFAFVGCHDRNCDVYISSSDGRDVKRVEGTRGVRNLLAWTD